jgi:hypothetical protein
MMMICLLGIFRGSVDLKITALFFFKINENERFVGREGRPIFRYRTYLHC